MATTRIYTVTPDDRARGAQALAILDQLHGAMLESLTALPADVSEALDRAAAVLDRTPRLVRASSQAQARSHVAAGVFAVAVASADDVARAMEAGARVEDAARGEPEPA